MPSLDITRILDLDLRWRRIWAAVPRWTDTEIVLELMRLVAGFGVSHTRVSWPGGALAFHEYPVEFYWFSDGLAVASVRPEYEEALGARVIRLGLRKPRQAQEALAAYVPHENKANLLGESPVFLRKVELLQYLRIADTVVRSAEEKGMQQHTGSLRARWNGRFPGFPADHFPYASPRYSPGAYPRSDVGRRLSTADEFMAVARAAALTLCR